MVFCKNCGAEIPDGSIFCTNCGNRQDAVRSTPVEEDYVALWAILGFLLPLVGIILWAVWMRDKPKSSRASGLGALVGILVSVISIIIVMAFAFNSGNWTPID